MLQEPMMEKLTAMRLLGMETLRGLALGAVLPGLDGRWRAWQRW